MEEMIIAALIAAEIKLLPTEIAWLAKGFTALVGWVDSMWPSAVTDDIAKIVNGIVVSKQFAVVEDEIDQCLVAAFQYLKDAALPADTAKVTALVTTLYAGAKAP